MGAKGLSRRDGGAGWRATRRDVTRDSGSEDFHRILNARHLLPKL
jgi:hypothetical protein